MNHTEQNQFLKLWHEGSKEAGDRVFELALKDLHHIAHCLLEKEFRRSHTLQSHGLVHQFYLKMSHTCAVPQMDQRAFLRFAAYVMKQVLVDYGRKRLRRAEGHQYITFDDENPDILSGSRSRTPIDLHARLSLNSALKELSAIDTIAAQVADFKLNHGLSLRNVSFRMSLPYDGVKQEWRCAALF